MNTFDSVASKIESAKYGRKIAEAQNAQQFEARMKNLEAQIAELQKAVFEPDAPSANPKSTELRVRKVVNKKRQS